MTYVTVKLNNSTPPTITQSLGNAPRQFTGIAHSGKPFRKWDTRYVVDLSNIQYNAKTGVLMEHNPDKKCGVGQLSVGVEGLQIDGTLLSTEFGKHVADTANEGYPWELSAFIQSARQEQLKEGEMVVNGQTVAAPIVILRDCTVREVSFVAVGADAHTHAVLLSDGSPFKPDFTLSQQSKQENTMTKEEQAEFDALKAEVETLKAEKAKLEKEKADAEKKANVDKKLSAAGFQTTENGFAGIAPATYSVLLSLNEEQADALIGNLKLAANSNPQSKPPLPSALMGDNHTPQGEVKLSGLVVAAQARNKK